MRQRSATHPPSAAMRSPNQSRAVPDATGPSGPFASTGKATSSENSSSPAGLSNYGREGATAFTAGGRHFGVTVDRDSDSMLSRSRVADGRRARQFAGRQGYLVRVLGTAISPSGFDWHGQSNESSAP